MRITKSSIVLGAIGALMAVATAQAETTLYGSARAAVKYNDPDAFDDEDEDDFEGSWDVAADRVPSPQLGVRGSEDLGNGLSAVYQYEFGVDTTEGGNFVANRPKFIGLKGGFGTVTLGVHTTPYYIAVGIVDVFNDNESLNYLQSNGTRRDNSVFYQTPSLGGLFVDALVRMDGANGDSGIDEWNVTARYGSRSSPLFGAVTYVSDDAADTDQWAVAAGYVLGDLAFSAVYQDGDDRDGVDAQTGSVTGAYTFGNNIMRVGYAHGEADDAEDADFWSVGLQHNFSKRTRIWVEYFRTQSDADTVSEAYFGERDRDLVSIGMRHDF